MIKSGLLLLTVSFFSAELVFGQRYPEVFKPELMLLWDKTKHDNCQNGLILWLKALKMPGGLYGLAFIRGTASVTI